MSVITGSLVSTNLLNISQHSASHFHSLVDFPFIKTVKHGAIQNVIRVCPF